MQLPKLLNPDRVAAATIRGYLVQAHYSVLRWLALSQNEVMLCEGDEDIDRYLLDSDGDIVAVEQEQIKDLTGRISARDPDAHESIFNFLRSFHSHHSAGLRCTFVFTTTATLKDQKTLPATVGQPTPGGARLLIDVLREWSNLDTTSTQETLGNLRAAILELACEYGPLPPTAAKTDAGRTRAEALERAIAYLDDDPARWREVLLAVCWQSAQPGLTEVRGQIVAAIGADPRTNHLPAEVILPRLVAEVLGASARSEASDRVLTQQGLVTLAQSTEDALRQWCAAHPKVTGVAISELSARMDEIQSRVEVLELASDPVEKLKSFSKRALFELSTHTSFTMHGAQVAVSRGDLEEIVAMARNGNVVVVGDAGSGKSGTLHGVATRLASLGHDTVVVTADDLPTLELGVSLGQALHSWQGKLPAYLIVDALDSPREESAAKRMRQALQEVIQLHGRWVVVASSRTFDLHPRSAMAELFRGSPHEVRFDAGLALVRHFKVEALSDSELDQLRTIAPQLALVVAAAPREFRDLLRVPFNLSLAATLVESGMPASEFRTIRTQLELLDYYWERRVGEPAAGARYSHQAVVRSLTENMIRSRRLVVGLESTTDTGALPALLSAHVLVHPRWTNEGVPDVGQLAFSHRVLFDYAVAAVFLPSAPTDFVRRVSEQPDLVLLSPAGLEMYFERAWAKDSSRALFWNIAIELMKSREAREIAKVVPAGVAARATKTIADVRVLLLAVRSTDEQGRLASECVLRHFVGAALAAARTDIPFAGEAAGPWSELTNHLATIGSHAAIDSAWRLLSVVCENTASLTEAQLLAAGEAARAVFAWCGANSEPTWLLGLSTELVCRTFSSDPVASAAVIRATIEPRALQRCGHVVLLRMANALPTLLASSPALVAEIFSAAFRVRDESEERTDIGGLVLRLASNRRQDYEGGLYALQSEFPRFLETDFVSATRSIVEVVEAYVEREHPVENVQLSAFTFHGVETRVLTDYSSIWDSEPHADELVMLAQWEDRLAKILLSGPGAGIDASLAIMARGRGFAVLWRRLLAVAARTAPTADAYLRELLVAPPILMCVDTSEVAGNYLATAFAALDLTERERIEKAILSIPDDLEARDRLLGRIGDLSLLVTDEARARLCDLQAANAVPPHKPRRIRRIPTQRDDPEARLERAGVQVREPANRLVLDLLEQLKAFDALASNVVPPADTLVAASNTMTTLHAALGAPGVHPVVQSDALDRLAVACERLAAWGPPDEHSTQETRRFLLDAARSPSPKARADSSSFDDSPSWGQSARISAAAGLCDIAFKVGTLDHELYVAIERLCVDPEPAVRYQVARRVACLHRDPTRMWKVIEAICTTDGSRGVLQGLIAGLRSVAGMDFPRSARCLIGLLDRVRTGSGAKHTRELAVSLLAALYMDVDEAEARSAIVKLAADPASNDVAHLPFCMRTRLGISGGSGEKGDGIRRRAWALMTTIVDAAIPPFLAVEELLRKGERLSEQELAKAQALARLLDTIGKELYFASGARESKEVKTEDSHPAPNPALYFQACSAVVHALADVGMPGLAHHLLQLLDHLVPVDPGIVFLHVARVVKGAEKSGYQYDGFAVKLIVQIVTRYLSEYRALLREDEPCRKALLDVLDTFVRAGWPEARRLTYDLRLIFQ